MSRLAANERYLLIWTASAHAKNKVPWNRIPTAEPMGNATSNFTNSTQTDFILSQRILVLIYSVFQWPQRTRSKKLDADFITRI